MTDQAAIETRVAGFTDYFKRVHFDVMFGMPVCNNMLEVEAVGFRDFNGDVVGIFITPWFLKVFLLPEEPEMWSDQEVGSKVTWTFPAGEFQCLTDFDEGIGSYISHSLYSPMAQFKTQDEAREAAEAAIKALMTEPSEEEKEIMAMDPKSGSGRRRLFGGMAGAPTSDSPNPDKMT
ncbi:MAG: [NiFe]-hydrogenase assembly chaperone HybE [Magnetovibrionaceae bacterium]